MEDFSDTPRTDGNIALTLNVKDGTVRATQERMFKPGEHEFVQASFARMLEEEQNEMRRRLMIAIPALKLIAEEPGDTDVANIAREALNSINPPIGPLRTKHHGG